MAGVLLERVRLVQVGPFDEVKLRFTDEAGEVHGLTVVHGDAGTGKSAIASAIGGTRPGRAASLASIARGGARKDSHAICHWRLRAEDPERPHPLVVATPTVKLGEGEEETLRRREQAHFDRQAAEGKGFAYVEIPGQRYFSRSALLLSDPTRTLLRYDPRQAITADQSRLDLARACKQAMAYAGISAALAGDRKSTSLGDPRLLGAAMTEAVQAAVALGGHEYRGVEPNSLEPMFTSPGGRPHLFDSLPTMLRHLVALVALPIRTLWAANIGVDPREAEGVIVVDDADLHLGPHVLAALPDMLRKALPRAQWILTTASPVLAAACGPDCLLTLRRLPESDGVELYEDELAITH